VDPAIGAVGRAAHAVAGVARAARSPRDHFDDDAVGQMDSGRDLTALVLEDHRPPIAGTVDEHALPDREHRSRT
jgi:hypothetical protein